MTRLLVVVAAAVATLLGLIGSASAWGEDRCLCKPGPCETPLCCNSGETVYDECLCCQQCAKDEGESCGGNDGVCADDLVCRERCDCHAVMKGHQRKRKCIFPFKYKGKTYHTCTEDHSTTLKPWCALETNYNDYVVEGKWGDCDCDSCPTEYRDCKKKIGTCIYDDFDPYPHIYRMMMMPRRHPRRRPKTRAPPNPSIMKCDGMTENMCRCDPNQRDRCEQRDEWCWLENLDVNNPQMNCFEDVQYSARFGRFWSSEACNMPMGD